MCAIKGGVDTRLNALDADRDLFQAERVGNHLASANPSPAGPRTQNY